MKLCMSVLIKGVEMPKGCATCPYCDRAWNKPKCKAKSTQGRFMEQRLNLDRTRQKWCPLVPVPPHGDLVERQAVLNTFSVHMNRTLHFATIRDTVPTIIPADGGE